MKRISIAIIIIGFSFSLLAGCGGTKEAEDARRGAKYGAAGGALLGLTMGALTGDAKLAAAGAVTGAAVGGASGAMYEYDQSREDNRTKMMADAIGGAKKGETVDQAGTRHLQDFLGDWKMDIWVLGADGKRITATGEAKGIMESSGTTKVTYHDIKAAGYDGTYAGYSLIHYDPAQGFSLENNFSNSPEVLKFVGEYMPEKNSYNYYLTTHTEGKTVTGIVRSNVRLVIRIASPNLWFAETYTLVDGKEVQIQSYRFTKS